MTFRQYTFNSLSINKSRMSRLLFIPFMAIVAISCSHNERSELGHLQEKAEKGPEEAVEHNEGDEIILMPDVAERMGVVTDTVRPGDFHETLSVGGEITSAPSSKAVVTSPTSGIVTLAPGLTDGTKVGRGEAIATVSAKNMSGGDSNAAALAAMEAAKRELDRITPLHADGIVSTRDYNAALQAYETAKAAYSPSAASGRAVSPIAGTVGRLLVSPGSFVNAGDPIADISSASTITLRADLPDRQARLLDSVKDANFRTAYSDKWYNIGELNGKVSASTGGAGTAAGAGYSPIYFTFDNPGNIVPGTYAEVILLGSPREGVISVPTESLSEQQGALFVYVRLNDHGYEKRHVTTGGNDGIRTEILSGLKTGERVVVKGATIVKLAESSGAVPEGHSHNH